jgi:hypothetical protein
MSIPRDTNDTSVKNKTCRLKKVPFDGDLKFIILFMTAHITQANKVAKTVISSENKSRLKTNPTKDSRISS